MPNLTQAISGKYEPKQALIIYTWGSEYYVESHKVVDGQLMEGKPLEHESIIDMANYFAEKRDQGAIISGVIPDTLLFCEWNSTRRVIAWFNLPQERMMHFTDRLKIAEGTAAQPGLIYVFNDGELRVFAYKGKGKPKEGDILYRPPYHNCSWNGKVCLGNAKAPKPKQVTYASKIAQAERLFWGSEFSHLAGNESPLKGNVNTYWSKAIKSKAPFDNNVLLPANPKLSVGQLLKNLSK